MAASCDDQGLNQRIIDAFRAHYDDMVEAMSVCAGKVARVLYEIKIIHIETMKEASEVGWSKYQKSITVVNAIDVYIKSRESSSHSLEVLDILEKHPPLDGVVAKIRKHMQHSRTPDSSFEESMSIEEEVISNEGINSNAGTDLNAGTNQRFVRAFRSHFKMLVDVLDPEEAALALYQEKLISKTTLEEALSSNGSKFKRSYKIVDAMETYLGICTSTTTALKILTILELNSTSSGPDSVIARIRRQAMSFGGSSEEEISTSESPGTRPRLILGVSRRMSGEFSLLKQRFASMMMVAKRLLLRKQVDINELKERLLISYREEISRDSLFAANSIGGIFKEFILPRCTVTNYFLLSSLADELDIPEITVAIEKFERSEEEFNTCLLEEEFAGVVRAELLRHQSSDSELPRTEIRLIVVWAKTETTLTEFRYKVQDVFPGLNRWIDLAVVNMSGSLIAAAESNLAEAAVSTVAGTIDLAGSLETVESDDDDKSDDDKSIDAAESDGGAESDFAVVKEHIKQQGSVDVLSLKSYLIGPSRVGKTTTLRRLTGEINHLSPDEIVPSTGIDKPLTVQLYTHRIEQSSVLVSEGWHSQGLDELRQTLCSRILNSAISPPFSSSSSTSQQSVPSSVKPTSFSVPLASSAETTLHTESTEIVSSPIPSPSTQSKLVVQDDIISEFLSPVYLENTRRVLKNLKNYTLVHFVDIGGQPEFHEILPLLLHGLALNFIFFDMTQNLDSPYKVVYRDGDSGSSSIQYTSEFSIREVIQRALHSISSLQSNTNFSKPAAILVGTHHDKCSEEDVLTVEQSVHDTFANFIEDSVLCPVSKPGEKKRYIHPVNNVSEDSSDIKSLRELITTTVHNRFKPEPVPISTMLLHLILRMKFDPTPGWCSLEKCIEIAERCGISREDLTKEGGILQYLHDRFGTILYYRGLKIGQRVIVNPNIIMRPPVELFVTAFGTKTSEQATAERIRDTGEIPHRLMKKVCSSSKDQSTANEIPTDEIVELLKSRYILYENTQSDSGENFYFLPCLLYPDHKIDKESKDLCHLISLTYPPILLIPEAGYVPLGPFPATVVKLSQSSHWTLAKRPRFRNRIRFYFQLPTEQVLDVELRALSTHLELRIRHDAPIINPRLIPECLHELTKFFDNVLLFYPHTQGMKWDFGFYCPHAIQSGRCPHPARCNTKDKPQNVICSQEGCKDGPVDLEDKHKCWFTEIVIASNQSHQFRDDHDESSCKYKDPPTMKQLVKAVAIVSDWRMLGINLDVDMTELNDIHTTYHVEGLNTLKMVMLDKWLKKCPAASWDDLIEALTDMGEVTAADQIKAGRPQKPLPETDTCDDEGPPKKKHKQD